MLGKTYESTVCSLARTLELVGERWSLLIVRDALFAGATRFSDFRSLGIASNILTSRLDSLVASGIMERLGNTAGEHHQYRLTPKGRELGHVILAFTQWGDRWAAPDGAPVLYTHAACGGQMTQHAVCGACGDDVEDPADIRARPGPGMPPDLASLMG
jgi:DNA-binding HxlR family transcriptional regulator